MQIFYIILCIAGATLPLSQFIPWLSAHGLDIALLLQQATSSHIASFAWADVLISGIVVIVFILVEGRRLAMRRLWLPLSCMIVGPSLALPLFLFNAGAASCCGRIAAFVQANIGLIQPARFFILALPMTQPNLESQTPPAKVLFPLGAACIILPLLCMIFLDLGPVSSIMAIIVIVMGAGMVWQGTKNLKRDKV